MRTLLVGVFGWLLFGAGAAVLFRRWEIELLFAGALLLAAGPGLLPAWQIAWRGWEHWETRAEEQRAARVGKPGWNFPGEG